MKIGDLVEYLPSLSYGLQQRDIGTITIVDGDRNHRSQSYYIVWHTTDNEGWWNGGPLKVVGKNENR